MGPFMKGALGFFGCAAVCTAAYQIGKHVGREETLKEVEQEERHMAAPPQQVIHVQETAPVQQEIIPVQEAPEAEVTQLPVVQEETPSGRVRRKHGFKNTIFGTAGVIKDIFKDPDGKKMVATVEDGDLVLRISQNAGG